MTTRRWLQIAVGLLVATVGVLAGLQGWRNMGWGSLSQLMLFLMGATIVFNAIWPGRFGRSNLTQAYTTTAVLLLNTLLLFVLIETMIGVFVNVRDGYVRPRFVDVAEIRENLPYYQQVRWGQAHWAEIDTIPERYAPFTVWVSQAFEGETATVREDGTRLTPSADCDAPDAYTVFVFGGSTVWGFGAPDEGTIPAYIQRTLEEQRNDPVCVVNYGMFGYVATQGTIRLMLELQRGHMPDAVIFYDGINDVLATSQNQAAAGHQNMAPVARAFEPNTLSSALLTAWQRTNTYRLVVRWVPDAPGPTLPSTEQLAQDTADAYLLNYNVVANLADVYGFDYAFFWQPVLPLGDKTLTPDEAQFVNGIDTWLDLYAATYAEVEAAAPNYDNLHYSAGIFDEVEAFLWIDPFHVTPEGNAVVAQHMLDTITLTSTTRGEN